MTSRFALFAPLVLACDGDTAREDVVLRRPGVRATWLAYLDDLTAQRRREREETRWILDDLTRRSHLLDAAWTRGGWHE